MDFAWIEFQQASAEESFKSLSFFAVSMKRWSIFMQYSTRAKQYIDVSENIYVI